MTRCHFHALTWLFAAVSIAGSSVDNAFARRNPTPDFSSPAVRGAIVVVSVSGVNTKIGNVPQEVRGTGFFISRDGHLVTCKHLLTQLGDLGEGVPSWAIHFSAGDDVSAAPVYIGERDDLVVLYAPVADRELQILRRGSRDDLKLGVTPIYAAGYPRGWQYSVFPGVISSLGALAPLQIWSTNLTFKGGQSGSPILRADSQVLAVAKGNDAEGNIGVIVPIRPIPLQWWDTP